MRLNPSVARITPYVGGRPIAEVVREYGVEEVIKLASNESPTEPFPEVVEVIRSLAASVNRYPDSDCHRLTIDAAKHLSVPGESLWFGSGSSELLRVIASSIGGPGTKAVMGWPSFAMYPIVTMVGGADPVMVALDPDHRIDLDGMESAIDESTTVVYVCNPNNPTGTYLPPRAVEAFISRVPERVLVVVDEAYAEYATAHDFGTMIPLALRKPNVVVLRTFSKIYGLAGLRVGYAVGTPPTLRSLRRSQRPFTVTEMAQEAAREALRYPGRVEERRRENERGRGLLVEGLLQRGLDAVRSQANFVYFEVGTDLASLNEELLKRGVIIRLSDAGWARVSVGTEYENRRFLMVLDQVL